MSRGLCRCVPLRPAASRCVPLVAMIARLRDRMWVGVGRKNGRNAERNRHRLHRVGKERDEPRDSGADTTLLLRRNRVLTCDDAMVAGAGFEPATSGRHVSGYQSGAGWDGPNVVS